MTIIEDVKNKYEYYLTVIFNKNKYYHFKSIENFMLGFDEFGSMNIKYKVANILNKYFDYVMDNDINSNKEGKYIYFTFIEPLGIFYKKNLDFSFLFSLTTFFIYFVPALLVMLYLKFLIVYTLGVFTLGIFIYIKLYLQRKSKKVFGYEW